MALMVWVWCNVDVGMVAPVMWVLWHRRHGHCGTGDMNVGALAALTFWHWGCEHVHIDEV